jgi:hypothetical protein
MIASLEQQIQVLQVQAPRTPAAPVEPDAMLDVDEEYIAGRVKMRDRLTVCYFEWVG